MRPQTIHPALRVKFGHLVKGERNSEEISQVDLAAEVAKSGISCNQGVISKIETGATGVDLSVLRAVAETLALEGELENLLKSENSIFTGICENPDCSEVLIFISADLLVFKPYPHTVKGGSGKCHFGHPLRVSCDSPQCSIQYEMSNHGRIATAPCNHGFYSQDEIMRHNKSRFFFEKLSRLLKNDEAGSKLQLQEFEDEVRAERERRIAEFEIFRSPFPENL